ncbi:hypothetical protein CEXT_786401 [Caerostris extrusa]|uniref:Ribosomal protein L2 n=1 Tax=Caerostris extrusa TaxID=172846 RepID=A0AAV4NLD3_CAEEX|nr:hypothetical protein CEXT_786401 [Caerostris extrusa]
MDEPRYDIYEISIWINALRFSIFQIKPIFKEKHHHRNTSYEKHAAVGKKPIVGKKHVIVGLSKQLQPTKAWRKFYARGPPSNNGTKNIRGLDGSTSIRRRGPGAVIDVRCATGGGIALCRGARSVPSQREEGELRERRLFRRVVCRGSSSTNEDSSAFLHR